MARTRKPRLHDETVAEIPKHDFKRHEWFHCDSAIYLRTKIQDFRREFQISVWSESDIRYFLEMFPYLYREEGFKQHHIRCVATLVRGLYP